MPDPNALAAAMAAMQQQADASRLANRPQAPNPIVQGLAQAGQMATQAAEKQKQDRMQNVMAARAKAGAM